MKAQKNEDVDLEAGSEEPDFAPTSAAPAIDEEDDLEADPHSAFDTPYRKWRSSYGYLWWRWITVWRWWGRRRGWLWWGFWFLLII